MTWRGANGWDAHPGVRSGRRLGPGDRATDLVCRAAGSWRYLFLLAAGIAAAVLLTAPHDRRAGAVDLLALGLSAVALLEVTVVLMAARRHDRTTTELALYDLDQSRRSTAVAEDLRAEVQRLHADLARIAAQTERLGHTERLGYPVRGGHAPKVEE